MKTIEIVVSPQGETRVRTLGFVGNQCRPASRFLEEALGKVVSESLTADFHSTTSRSTRQLEREV
ncbi:MAG: DUF2997 domain-containing protein [Planctomycetales bacterium]|nr:DUF2997 domain-containing protein [Planctomycetales bacterium]